MEVMELMIILIVCFVLTLYVVMIGQMSRWKDAAELGQNRPHVSLIIPLRNEEEHLPGLLRSLKELDYPKERLEILIGNDDSSDNTAEILSEHTLDNLTVIDIEQHENGMSGKTNALIQLTGRAKGDYLLFTDGDVEHNKNWVRGMVAGVGDQVGLVAGYTGIATNNLVSTLQDIESVFAQGMLKLAADRDRPQSISGNNMLIRKDVFDEVGGFSDMNFTLVEDVALMRKIVVKGLKVNFKIDQSSSACTQPPITFDELVSQRRRWMKGFGDVPLYAKMFLISNGLFLGLIMTLMVVNPILGALFLLIKLTASLIFVEIILRRIRQKISYIHILLYEFFSPLMTLLSLVVYWFPGRTIWKGREY